MTILLYIALGYLFLTTIVLYRNRLDFGPLKSPRHSYFNEEATEVSICVPARNEENAIEGCVRSAVDQQYPNHKVYVLDDESTDRTKEILESLTATHPDKLTILAGKKKPEGWLGKSWACHQLSQAATGEILVFIDADTWLDQQAIPRLVRTMGHDVIDFATIWPEQKMGTFREKIAIPLIYFALLTLLPVRYVYRSPKWLPPFLRKKVAPLFAAACGQFMAFKREAYETIGGHESVKDKVVEDVALAKNIKRAGYTMNMYHGKETVRCRMYTSGPELWEGLRKNFLAGFGYHIPFFIGMGLLHFITFILPVIALPFLIPMASLQLLIMDLSAVLFMIIQRITVDRWFNWNAGYSLLHPLGVCWYESLGIQVLFDYFREEPILWKEREI